MERTKHSPAYLILFFTYVLCLMGWVLNVISLIQMDNFATGLGFGRLLGVAIPPLGAVLGWFF